MKSNRAAQALAEHLCAAAEHGPAAAKMEGYLCKVTVPLDDASNAFPVGAVARLWLSK